MSERTREEKLEKKVKVIWEKMDGKERQVADKEQMSSDKEWGPEK